MKRSITNETAQYSISLLVVVAGLFAKQIFIFYAAKMLSPKEFGQLVWVLAQSEILAMIFLFGGGNAFIREVLQRSANPSRSLLLNYLIVGTKAILLIVCACATVAYIFLGQTVVQTYALVALIAVSNCFLELMKSSTKIMGFAIISEIPKSIILPVIATLAFVLHGNIPSKTDIFNPGTLYLLSCATALAISTLGTLFLLRRLPDISDDNLAAPSIARWFVVSAPLMAYALLFQFNTQAAVLLSGYLGHQAEAGLLGFASSYASFSTLGLLAVNVIVVPKIAALYRSGELASLQKMLSKANLFAIFVFVLIATLLWIIKPYYISSSGFQHEQVSEAIDLIILAQFVSVLCGTVGYVTIMTKKQREAIGVLTISMIVQIAIIFFPLLSLDAKSSILAAYVASIVVSNIGLLWVCIVRVRVSPFFGLAGLSSLKMPSGKA
ncbi:lipopolysaccharide biosynthesis protein [Agrobacterium tumefaciens]|uniref:lipopolysaccharide biosynthesis protein n=1 Tax=Agrobacterium tumefaciens TaxID=358 RepID=UPI002242F7D7|nr:hypothetical protein [Agrobacterium tumefaciens]MCW8060211.1 hypothetical protein [Agrobacterium tumefaciens]MCW8146999.1 hypothetical protein [Agrobacterium tumefaciens]